MLLYYFSARHIAKVDKFHGCYRGLIPQLCASTISNFAYDKTFSKLTCVICDDEIYEVDDDAADRYVCMCVRIVDIENDKIRLRYESIVTVIIILLVKAAENMYLNLYEI